MQLFSDEEWQRFNREAIARNHEEHARYVREGHSNHRVRQLGALERLELAIEKLTETVRGKANP
jgi:hypothetical protein